MLTSDDVQADDERLKAKGVEFGEPPKRQPWGAETTFRDPDGNTFVLQQAA